MIVRHSALIALALVAGQAQSAPFVVSDPYPSTATQPTEFLVTLDGVPTVQFPSTDESGLVYLKFDIAGLSPGIHTLFAGASNADQVSSNSPLFTFDVDASSPPPAPLAAPGGLRLVPQ